MEQYIRIMTCLVGMIVAALSLIMISRVRASEAQKWTNNAILALLTYHMANYVKPWFAIQELYVYMQIVMYISTLVLGISFGFAMLEFCEIKMPLFLRHFLVVVAAICVGALCTIGRHKLWFGDTISFYENTEVPYLYENQWEPGIMYYVFNIIMMLIVALFVVFIFISVLKKKGKKTRILRRLLLVLLLPASVTILSLVGTVPYAMVTHATFVMLNIALMIIVIRYDITTTVTDAKEQAVETVDDGIIIMDKYQHFQYANQKAIDIFPELDEENPDLVTAFIELEFVERLIQKNGRSYEIRKDIEKDSYGRKLGNLILIHDITEQEERIREQEKTYRAQETLDQAIKAMAQAIDAKDQYTRGHSSRVAEYARMLAQRLELSEEEIGDIYRMGLLHDVGKIGIDDAIIRKDTSLTDEEYILVKSHPQKGDKILQNITAMPELRIGARWHHERYDGKGYPDQLKGEEIPLYARIIAVADSYDAMASNRSYRSYLPQDEVRAEIEKGKGTQFDPFIADKMLEIIDEDIEYRWHE